MSNASLENSLAAAENILAERLSRFPDSPFFLFAAKELGYIRHQSAVNEINSHFYEGLNIGVMCARELESVDAPFCDAVYNLLEDVRITAGQKSR